MANSVIGNVEIPTDALLAFMSNEPAVSFSRTQVLALAVMVIDLEATMNSATLDKVKPYLPAIKTILASAGVKFV
jgi:hypothetical protein